MLYQNGPNTFEKASKVLEDPPRFESSEVRTPPTYSQVYNESSNVSEQKKGSPMTTPSFASQGGTSGTVLSSSSQVDRRHSGIFNLAISEFIAHTGSRFLPQCWFLYQGLGLK